MLVKMIKSRLRYISPVLLGIYRCRNEPEYSSSLREVFIDWDGHYLYAVALKYQTGLEMTNEEDFPHLFCRSRMLQGQTYLEGNLRESYCTFENSKLQRVGEIRFLFVWLASPNRRKKSKRIVASKGSFHVWEMRLIIRVVCAYFRLWIWRWTIRMIF